jgi:galactokinase
MVDNELIPDPPVRLLAAFHEAFPDTAIDWMVRAPGRDTWIAAGRTNDAELTVAAPDMDAKVTFSLQSARVRRTVMQRPLPKWARYPAGVTLALDNAGLDMIGLNLVVIADEPPGPQFDYGVGMAFATLWHTIHERDYTIDRLIEIVDRARREYVEE